jgi:hypothetical protein
MRVVGVVAVLVMVACWQTSPSQRTHRSPSGGPQPPNAQGADPSVYLATWGDNRSPSPQGNHQVFAARMRANGTLVDRNGIAVDTRPHRARPIAVVDATKTGWWIASELSQWDTLAKKELSVWAQRVAPDGVPGARILVSDVLQDSVDFDLASVGDIALVAWAGIRRTKTEAALVARGQRIVVALPANTGRRPAVTFDPVTDNFVLVYRESSAITCAVIDRAGSVNATFQIPTAPTRVVDDGAHVAPIGTGEVLLTWVDADNVTVTAARIDVASTRITARDTLWVAPGTMLRHDLVRGTRGLLFAWHALSPPSQAHGVSWIDGSNPLGSSPRPLVLPLTTRIDETLQVQAASRGFLVTWLDTGAPLAVRVDATGNVLDTAPLSLRPLESLPVATATLQTELDATDRGGTDYCPQQGHDRRVPPAVRGLYVVEGQQPWGALYIPGFGWGGSTGSRPRRSVYVGRGAEFVPHFKAHAGTAHPFELTVEIPDAKRQRKERIPIDTDDGASAAAAGIAGPLDLVELEVNGGLGGKGLHFVITKARRIEDANVLAPRFVAARAELDKLVKSSRKDLDRVLADAKRRALAANPYPTVKGNVPRSESVIYWPTYRPSTGRIEVLFGYRLTEGVMMKFPPPKPDTTPHKHEDGPPLPNPRPLSWALMFGARYTLDGDKLVQQEVWEPSVVGADIRAVPWQCTPPKGSPSPAQPVAACSGPPPAPDYTCVQNCGPPVSSDKDPPPGWSWLSPAQVDNRRKFGCPICLPGSARVATPDGEVAISELAPGARVLTLDETGRRVPATVVHAGSTLAGSAHRVVRVELSDGRVVTGSPGHPRAGGGTLGDTRKGDILDGTQVTRVELVPLAGERTWDILPSGSTGLYIIDGVVLRSSFAR